MQKNQNKTKIKLSATKFALTQLVSTSAAFTMNDTARLPFSQKKYL